MTMVATPPLGGRFEKSKRAPVQVSAAGSFAQARRHSAHVRLLRWAIPVGVATAVAMVAGDAPGKLALTVRVGKSTLGRSATDSAR